MIKVSLYLHFENQTEAAFSFYKTVFGTEFINGISRFGDQPSDPGQPPMPEEIKNLVLNVQLPIPGGVVLMGGDSPKGVPGFDVKMGNNITIVLEPDSREETDKYFNALSEGGQVTMPMADTFWNAYYGQCTDKFGIYWSFNCDLKKG